MLKLEKYRRKIKSKYGIDLLNKVNDYHVMKKIYINGGVLQKRELTEDEKKTIEMFDRGGKGVWDYFIQKHGLTQLKSDEILQQSEITLDNLFNSPYICYLFYKWFYNKNIHDPLLKCFIINFSFTFKAKFYYFITRECQQKFKIDADFNSIKISECKKIKDGEYILTKKGRNLCITEFGNNNDDNFHWVYSADEQGAKDDAPGFEDQYNEFFGLK